VFALGACAGPARTPVASFGEVGERDAVLVGRVEIVPPLDKSAGDVGALNARVYRDTMFLLADEQRTKLTQEPGVADYAGRIEATPNKTFFVGSSRKPFYVLGGVMFLNVSSQMERAYFPGGFKADVRPGDKAVYLGTIQYHRNEFFEITKVVIVDDYERANAEYRKKFGGRHALRKALLTRVK
jgi:hypothetical protein